MRHGSLRPATTRLRAGAAALLFIAQANLGVALLLVAGCSEPPERATSLATLARWEDRRLAEADSLAAMVTSRDAHVRRAAMRAAGMIGRDDILPELVRGLADRSASVREAAATALGFLGSPQGAAPLGEAAGGQDRALARAALEALGRVPNDGLALLPAARHGGVAEATRAWDSLREQAARVPPDSLLAALAVALTRDEPEVVWHALRCAEKLPDSTTVPLLAPLARSRDAQVRVHALRALAQQRTPAALAAVLISGEQNRLFSERERVRIQIALGRALGRLSNVLLRDGVPLAVDPDLARTAALLATGSRDREPHVARTMLDAMTACVDGIPLPAAAALRESLLPIWRLRLARAAEARLTVAEPAVLAAAVEAFGTLRGAAAAPRLATLAESDDPRLASAAVTALGRCGEIEHLPILTAAAAPGRRPLAREAALAAAATLERRLRERAQATGGGIPVAAAVAAVRSGVGGLLVDASRDDDFAVAATAAGLLGQIPGPAVIVALCEAFARASARREGAEDVRLGALEGLAAIGEQVPDSLRTRVASACELAFDSADVRLRVQGRVVALATKALPAALIPSEASLRATLPAAARSSRQPPICAPFDAPRLRCRTSRGDFEIALDGRAAPNTAAALLDLAQQGFYRAMTFHRVVPDFVIQGGDPRGDGWGGPGYSLRCEYSRLPFERGTVGVAHAGKDTGGSQFFVCHSPQPHLNGRYTVVGRVTRGFDVVDQIQPGDTFTLEAIE